MKLQRGSFTIEAVIWISLFVVMQVSVLQQGIYFYKTSRYKEISEENRNWDAVLRFYEVQIIKEIEEEMKNE